MVQATHQAPMKCAFLVTGMAGISTTVQRATHATDLAGFKRGLFVGIVREPGP